MRVFKFVLGLILAAVIAIGALFASIFVDKLPVQDGAVLNGHGITVEDGYSAAFLLPAADGQFALIDCGNDLDATAIKQALQKRGAGPDSVRVIFLTHGHPDHIAGCGQFPKAEVYGFAADAPMAAGDVGSKSPMGRLAGAQHAKTVKITRPLSDGQDVQIADLSVRAFPVPGHTRGSAAYLVRGVLYLGDSAKVNKDGTVSNAPWLFSEDQTLNAASVLALAKRLADEDVKVVAFSHTGTLDGLGPLLRLH